MKLFILIFTLSCISVLAQTNTQTVLIQGQNTNTLWIIEGDSISDGGTPPFSSLTWPTYARSNVPFLNNGKLTNFSVSSSKLIGTTNWIDGSTGTASPLIPGVTNRYFTYENLLFQSITNTTAKKHFVMMIGHNDVSLFVQTNVTWYWNNLTNFLINGPKTDGATVHICTILPSYSFGIYPWTPGNSWLLNWNDYLRKHWRDAGSGIDELIDVYQEFSDPRDTAYFGDGVHPTPLGAKYLADFITGTMSGAKVLNSQPKVPSNFYQVWNSRLPLRYAPYHRGFVPTDETAVFTTDGVGGFLNTPDALLSQVPTNNPVVQNTIPNGMGWTNLYLTYYLMPYDGNTNVSVLLFTQAYGLTNYTVDSNNITNYTVPAKYYIHTVNTTLTGLTNGQITSVTVNVHWQEDIYTRYVTSQLGRTTNSAIGPTNSFWLLGISAHGE